MARTVRVLFVCLGNICRSPTAEAVLRRLVRDAGLDDAISVDSAGTGDWHVGEPPDRRMAQAAKARGYALEGTARQVELQDFLRFDRVIAMDRQNLRALRALCPEAHRRKLATLRDWDPGHEAEDVPDPYYGGQAGFDEVVRIVERAAKNLLAEISREIEA